MGETRDEDGCGERLTTEFRWKSFGLSHPSPRLFVSSQWGCPKLYVGWRVFWALYHLGWLVYDLTDNVLNNARPATWLVFISNWNYLLLTLDTLLLAIVQVYVTCARRDFNDGQGAWYLKVTWLLYTVVSDTSILITVFYFAFVFDGVLTPLSASAHIMTSVYVLLDLIITAMPVRLFHVIYPMIFALSYIIFNVSYWAAGSTSPDGKVYIYAALDWRHPGKAAAMSLGVIGIGVPVQHVVFWCLHMLRILIWGCTGDCCASQNKIV